MTINKGLARYLSAFHRPHYPMQILIYYPIIFYHWEFKVARNFIENPSYDFSLFDKLKGKLRCLSLRSTLVIQALENGLFLLIHFTSGTGQKPIPVFAIAFISFDQLTLYNTQGIFSVVKWFQDGGQSRKRHTSGLHPGLWKKDGDLPLQCNCVTRSIFHFYFHYYIKSSVKQACFYISFYQVQC